jgi:hypothetical protein
MLKVSRQSNTGLTLEKDSTNSGSYSLKFKFWPEIQYAIATKDKECDEHVQNAIAIIQVEAPRATDLLQKMKKDYNNVKNNPNAFFGLMREWVAIVPYVAYNDDIPPSVRRAFKKSSYYLTEPKQEIIPIQTKPPKRIDLNLSNRMKELTVSSNEAYNATYSCDNNEVGGE